MIIRLFNIVMFLCCQVHKIRTVTTKANSIKQTTKMVFPVEEEDEVTREWKGDVLWCTELERYV